jgi:hypothetical protein
MQSLLYKEGMKAAIRTGSILGLASAVALANPPSLQPPDFSADIVTHNAAGIAINAGARLYVTRDKVRIETPEAATGFFLVDAQSTEALFVRPAQHVFMDARRFTRLTQLFLPVDPNNPCQRWQTAAKNAAAPGTDNDWRCERVSAGHTVGYIVGSTPENSTQRWIDPELSFPVKVRTAEGTTLELQHIKKEPQPAALFAVPAAYQKSDPQALSNRVKPSDVSAARIGHNPP